MPSRREFMRTVAGTAAGMYLTRGGMADVSAQTARPGAAERREVKVGGRRVKVRSTFTPM